MELLDKKHPDYKFNWDFEPSKELKNFTMLSWYLGFFLLAIPAIDLWLDRGAQNSVFTPSLSMMLVFFVALGTRNMFRTLEQRLHRIEKLLQDKKE